MAVLIVDDSKLMRRIHRNTLQEHGVTGREVIEAADGAEALLAAQRETITLFLVDWNMPKLDGFQFVKSIRAITRYAATPIIMITAEAEKENVVAAINAGVTNYVVKPITGDILWQKISQYLAKLK